MSRSTRRRYIAAVAALSTSGCLGARSLVEGGSEAGGADVKVEDAEEPNADGADAGEATDETSGGGVRLGNEQLPLPDDTAALHGSLISTGVSRDGIPSIDEPSFLPADEADGWLSDDEPVFGLEDGGDARAYPQRILVWHEIVNDRFRGENVAITYCPLTGTAQGFERGGTTLGVTGKLLRNNLVMYDRHTESDWPQMLATAITGEHEGETLAEFPLTWTTWGRWRDRYSGTEVLSEETGYIRNYNSDPYGSYAPAEGYYDREVVMGTRWETGSLAVSKEALSASRLLTTEIGSATYVAVADPSLDGGYFYRTTDEVSVEYADDDVLVGGDRYQPRDLPFERLLAYDAFRFAWEAFYPDSEVLT